MTPPSIQAQMAVIKIKYIVKYLEYVQESAKKSASSVPLDLVLRDTIEDLGLLSKILQPETTPGGENEQEPQRPAAKE